MGFGKNYIKRERVAISIEKQQPEFRRALELWINLAVNRLSIKTSGLIVSPY